jgi:5-methylthioadenosine/S-adenosylhomocysteine deaminase
LSDETKGIFRLLGGHLIDEEGRVNEGDVLLFPEGGWAPSIGDEDVESEVDATSKIITRSLQNWHTHLPMTLNRSMGEGLTLMDWLSSSIFPTERHVTPEFVSVGTRAAVAELIRGGTTFACDMYHFPGAIAPVLADAGLRGVVCGPTTDWPPPEDVDGGTGQSGEDDSGETFAELTNLIEAGSLADGRVEYGIATHAVYTCSEEILRRASELAERTGARLHIHTSETRSEVAECHEQTGMYPIEYLDSIDYFQTGTVCAHCGWVTKREMRILAEHKAHAVHCPVSNQKLATGGTMSYPAMREAGVDVRLGTDGAASNNGLDLRAEAKAASLIQRHDHWDATLLPPLESWNLATKGSRDWVTWQGDDIRMRPHGRDGRRLLGNLLYSSADCLDVFVDGTILRQNGVTLSLDESAAAAELEHAAQAYYAHI